MRYPDSYKCQTISITKFEKNFGPRITYSFMNAFPKLISAVPVSYGGADVLKVSVSFNYDRYVIGNNGFSKGFQDNNSFADPKQQSSELQQVQLNTLKSVIPPATTQTSTRSTTQTSTIPTPPAISADVQAGLDAASTESTRTGYVDPYKAIREQIEKNQADRERLKNRPDKFF